MRRKCAEQVRTGIPWSAGVVGNQRVLEINHRFAVRTNTATVAGFAGLIICDSAVNQANCPAKHPNAAAVRGEIHRGVSGLISTNRAVDNGQHRSVMKNASTPAGHSGSGNCLIAADNAVEYVHHAGYATRTPIIEDSAADAQALIVNYADIDERKRPQVMNPTATRTAGGQTVRDGNSIDRRCAGVIK